MNLSVAPKFDTKCNLMKIHNHKSFKIVVTPTGLEPVTISLEGWCSIHLSYGAMPASGADRLVSMSPGARSCKSEIVSVGLGSQL